MGSLATHFSTFLFLVPIGVRRLYSSFSLFLSDPSLYRSKPWFFFDPRWKNLDLYALLVALPIVSLTELFLFLSFSGHPSYRFSFLQHGIVIFIFWALLILIVLREFSEPFALNESFLFVLGGIAFLLEYFICKNGFTGVSNIVYDWLGCHNCCLKVSSMQEIPRTFCSFSSSSRMIPKETNPPFVLKSSIVSPLSSAGGMGDHEHGGALVHSSELPTSMSS
ncbi:hypothetical protein Cgig2_022144 [Carnegiea gigantea]|uniref:Uncharacterized protein n=1 Tax=Carnegiea gigantea TaxID=171969 RepID=A0A9Q1QBJ4_9CARY|nr:hypothetical protein Cgig2_022144 [Carnegiea gigantea]